MVSNVVGTTGTSGLFTIWKFSWVVTKTTRYPRLHYAGGAGFARIFTTSLAGLDRPAAAVPSPQCDFIITAPLFGWRTFGTSPPCRPCVCQVTDFPKSAARRLPLMEDRIQTSSLWENRINHGRGPGFRVAGSSAGLQISHVFDFLPDCDVAQAVMCLTCMNVPMPVSLFPRNY